MKCFRTWKISCYRELCTCDQTEDRSLPGLVCTLLVSSTEHKICMLILKFLRQNEWKNPWWKKGALLYAAVSYFTSEWLALHLEIRPLCQNIPAHSFAKKARENITQKEKKKYDGVYLYHYIWPIFSLAVTWWHFETNWQDEIQMTLKRWQ